MRAAFAAGVFGGAALWVLPAASAEPDAELSLERGPGAESCPDEAALRARVEELAAKPVFAAAGRAKRNVRVKIESSGEGFAAALEIDGASRQIDDSGPGCEVLGEALAVTVGILLDAQPARNKPKAPVDEPARPAAAPPEPPEPSVRLTGSLAGFYDFGTLESSAGGLAIAAELLVPYVSFGVSFVGLPNDPTDRRNDDDAAYRFVAGRVRACGRQPFVSQFGVGLCSGFTVGERRLDPGPNGGYAGANLMLEVSRRVVGPFGVFADLGLTFPFWYESIAQPGYASPFEPVTFQFGVGTRFWIAPYP